MRQPGNDTSTGQTELFVLRALCGEIPRGPLRKAAVRILAGYDWREPVHQVIFRCLMSMPQVISEDFRSQLVACLTRKGFPDVELEILFEPHSLSNRDVEELMQRLGSSAPARKASKKT